MDSTGNVWVADTGNKRIQQFTPTGIWQSTIDLSAAPCVSPSEIAFDATDVLHVVGSSKVCRYDAGGSLLNSWTSTNATGVEIDGSGHAWVTSTSDIVTVFDSAGVILATYGAFGSGNDQLNNPQGIAIAPASAPNAGTVYVADTGNGRVERFSGGGAYQTDWGHYPAPGVMDSPKGVAVDASDNVYVTNQTQGIIQKFDKDGALLAESAYGPGSGNGDLNSAAALAIDPLTGNLYVADTNNYRIQEFTAALTYVTQWGGVGTSDGQFNKPAGIAVDASGNIFVADTGNHRIQEFAVTTHDWVRTWGSSAPSFGGATGAFHSPKGLAIDGSGNVWVADSGNNRIQVFGSTGVFIRAWGSTGSGNGQLSGPSDIDIEAGGAVLVDDLNHARVQRFTTTGGYLDQLGSLGLDLYQFDSPGAIAVDGGGRLLVADTSNDRVQVFADLNGPDTTITGPGAISNLSSPSFAFSANDVGVTFECKMDAGSYASCVSGVSYSSLPDGDHTFSAYATDSLSNAGNPTTYPWTIDTVPPGVTITANPPLFDSSTSPSFSFSADEAVTGFTCQLDSGAPASCTSPHALSGLTDRSHTFQVWAYDLAGNQSLIASYTWTVDTTPPTVHIDSGPSGTVLVSTASFSFSSSTDPSATFQCQLDSGGFGPCTSPASYSSLTSGQHTFSVEAIDVLGNLSSPVDRNWTVDSATHRPDGKIATGTTFVGDNVYNTTGTNQTKTVKVAVGKTVAFKIMLQNDGADKDTYKVLGAKTGSGYTITYFDGTTNVTSQVTGGTYKIALDPGTSKVLTLKVKVGTSAVTSKSILVKATSTHDSTKVDAVKAVVKRM